MMFKFGVLVLLLLLENTAAEQILPRARFSLVSALQHGPHRRQDLLRADHSLVQGLPSSSFRRSLQSTDSSCAWDEDSEECSLSVSGMKDLLEESDTELAKIVVERLTCAEKTNKADCNKEEPCLWHYWMEECQYIDLRKSHEDSPCAKAAPLYFDWLEAEAFCLKQETSEQLCKSNRLCKWQGSDVFPSCDPERASIFYGINNFRQKMNRVENSIKATLEAEYEALQAADDFTWESLLDYEPSSFECPPDIEPLVCDDSVAILSYRLSLRLYCAGKYASDASGCDADALCSLGSRSGKCRRNEDQVKLAFYVIQKRVLVAAMPESPQKKNLEAYFTCAGISEPGQCTGNCIYNPNDDFCQRRKDFIAGIVTEAGKKTTDAVCTYVSTDGVSECYNHFTEEKCHEIELCRWNKDYECEPKNEFFLSAAADRDPRLKETYQSLKEQCSTHTTEDACVEPTKVY